MEIFEFINYMNFINFCYTFGSSFFSCSGRFYIDTINYKWIFARRESISRICFRNKEIRLFGVSFLSMDNKQPWKHQLSAYPDVGKLKSSRRESLSQIFLFNLKHMAILRRIFGSRNNLVVRYFYPYRLWENCYRVYKYHSE